MKGGDKIDLTHLIIGADVAVKTYYSEIVVIRVKFL